MADTQTKSTRGRKPSLTDSGRKRKKKEVNAQINRSRIYIGDQYDRWNDLKVALGVKTHADLTKMLLDRYDETSSTCTNQLDVEMTPRTPVPGPSGKTTSTPGSLLQIKQSILAPELSDICLSEYENVNIDEEMSRVEEIVKKKRKCQMKENQKKSDSFINPFEPDTTYMDLPMEYSDDDDNSDDNSDEADDIEQPEMDNGPLHYQN